MRNELLRFISLSLAIVCLSGTECKAQSAGTTAELHLDRMEVQHFEQSYEAWVQSIVHQILPKAHLSVLTEFNYSANPDLIQSYEERRAAAHLPGLPDVSDMNDSQPSENPIFELVTGQNIKLIFDQQPTDDQERILKEVLSVKLNLDSAHGDQISFDHLQGSNNYARQAAISFGKNARLNTILMMLAAFGVAAVIVRKNRAASKVKEIGEQEINALYAKMNPAVSILKTDAKLLISVIRKQDTSFLVQVMAHAPIHFNQIILQIFEEEQRKELFEAFQEQRLSVSRKKSRYSQLLLAAKLHDEAKIEAMQQVDVMNEVTAKITEQRTNMQQSLKQLKALYVSEETVENTEIEEVNHETSL